MKSTNWKRLFLTGSGLFVFIHPVWAHPGHGVHEGGWLEWLVHPGHLSSVVLAATVAVALLWLWSAHRRERSRNVKISG